MNPLMPPPPPSPLVTAHSSSSTPDTSSNSSQSIHLNRTESFLLFPLWVKKCTQTFFGSYADFEERSRRLEALFVQPVFPKFSRFFANPQGVKNSVDRKKFVIFHVVATKLENLIKEAHKLLAFTSEKKKAIKFSNWLNSSEGAGATLCSFRLFHRFIAEDEFKDFFDWYFPWKDPSPPGESDSSEFVSEFEKFFKGQLLPQYLMLRSREAAETEQKLSEQQQTLDANEGEKSNKRKESIETTDEPVASTSSTLTLLSTETLQAKQRKVDTSETKMSNQQVANNGNPSGSKARFPPPPNSVPLTSQAIQQVPLSIDQAAYNKAFDSHFIFCLILDRLERSGKIPKLFYTAFTESPENYSLRTCLVNALNWLDDRNFVKKSSFIERRHILFTLFQVVEFYFPKELSTVIGMYRTFYFEAKPSLQPLNLIPF